MISEISAELWLSYLYPTLSDKWIVWDKGSFYRNYSSDVMDMRLDENRLELSRDGFLRLLPDEVLSEGDELKSRDGRTSLRSWELKERRERLQRRIALLKEAFVPLDTHHFRMRLRLEKAVEEILEEKFQFILLKFFGFDIQKEKDSLVRKAALLLPYTVKVRGNLQFVQSLIQELTGSPVVIRRTDFSDRDNTRYWLPQVNYDVLIDDLTSEEYLKEEGRLRPLCDFLREYMLPFEAITEIHVKSRKVTNDIMNYNTMV